LGLEGCHSAARPWPLIIRAFAGKDYKSLVVRFKLIS
jgi:hypothetical protein